MYKQTLALSVAFTLACAFSMTRDLFAESTETKALEVDTLVPGAVYFTPPKGWQQADASALSPTVKMLVVGKGKGDLPPSIHLALEPYQGTLKDYMKIVKAINVSKGGEWKDLGKIRTHAGEGSLSQLDTKTQWGDMRMLHTIVLKNNTIYIMTAAALRDEFPAYYKHFFDAMTSLHVND